MMATDREILLDLLPGCTPDTRAWGNYDGWFALLPDDSEVRVRGGSVWWKPAGCGTSDASDDDLLEATPDEAREALQAYFVAWCNLVMGPVPDIVETAAQQAPNALYQFKADAETINVQTILRIFEQPAPMTLAEIEAANPEARDLIRCLIMLPQGATVTLADGTSWTRLATLPSRSC